ncbi:MAG: hypothetical protein GY757_59830 [bacterium]|nr:hypothetical protein [bacterium]
MPIWEAPIQPVTGNDLKGKKSKRPDFTCYYFNAHANSPEQQEIPFHVECKRLGCPGAKSPSWKFNDNYVSKGIKRFDCASFNYGKGAPSGMMIGYIISMSPEAIVCDVNGYQKEHLSHFPDIEFNFDVKAVFQGLQEIERLHVSPVQFELIHLWVDLRKNSN